MVIAPLSPIQTKTWPPCLCKNFFFLRFLFYSVCVCKIMQMFLLNSTDIVSRLGLLQHFPPASPQGVFRPKIFHQSMSNFKSKSVFPGMAFPGPSIRFLYYTFVRHFNCIYSNTFYFIESQQKRRIE